MEWNRLEKVTSSYLIKKFDKASGTRTLVTLFKNNLPIIHIFSQINIVFVFLWYFFKFYLNIVFPSRTTFFERSPIGFPHKSFILCSFLLLLLFSLAQIYSCVLSFISVPLTNTLYKQRYKYHYTKG